MFLYTQMLISEILYFNIVFVSIPSNYSPVHQLSSQEDAICFFGLLAIYVNFNRNRGIFAWEAIGHELSQAMLILLCVSPFFNNINRSWRFKGICWQVLYSSRSSLFFYIVRHKPYICYYLLITFCFINVCDYDQEEFLCFYLFILGN